MCGIDSVSSIYYYWKSVSQRGEDYHYYSLLVLMQFLQVKDLHTASLSVFRNQSALFQHSYTLLLVFFSQNPFSKPSPLCL